LWCKMKRILLVRYKRKNIYRDITFTGVIGV